MKLQYLLGMFLVAALSLSVVTVWLTITLKGALDNVVFAEQRRFNSILLADELRQSSDDLTKFARMYVQTGDQRFRDYFRRVLAIRNGKEPRPKGYEGLYWDRVVVKGTRPTDSVANTAASLQDRMASLGFTQVEFGLLAEAQKRSDDLAVIEERAFKAVDGLFDDRAGAYTRRGPPDMGLAQSLLYGADYLRAKVSIMEPIARFDAHVNARTAAELAAVRATAKSLLAGTLGAAGGLLGLLAVFSAIIHRRVLVRVAVLAGAASRIATGELEGRSGVRGKDELGLLGIIFDDMVTRLADALTLITAAKDRMEKELNVGRDIQMSMVPLTFPAFPEHEEFTIFASLEPAREVGGDFYDFFFIDEDRFCFCIGDVSGKGVSSALFMAVTKTLIKSRAAADLSTGSILTHVNDEISANNTESMFVTLFIGILNIRTGQVVFTNAGHNPPYVCRNKDTVLPLIDSHGPVIGAVEGMIYGEATLELTSTDFLFLYTDGVTEAMNTEKAIFSGERLAVLLETMDRASMETVVKGTIAAVKTFEGSADQTDDIAILALRYHGYTSSTQVSARQVVIRNESSEIVRVIEELKQFASQRGISSAIVAKLSLALDELLNNIVSYAYCDGDAHEISTQIEITANRLTVTITDDGVPFNPKSAKVPDTQATLETRAIGGLGIHLVRSLVDQIFYQRRIERNVLTILIRLDSNDA